MSRPLRIEYPGACYHVMNRGNGGEYVLKTKEDKRKFLEYLGKVRERFGVFIHAYCLMGNHYHLLAETPEPNLSRAIQWLNVSYATWYNRRRGRSGHLFQGRFKSILIDKGAYLKELSRYIHRNPVRAGMVKAPRVALIAHRRRVALITHRRRVALIAHRRSGNNKLGWPRHEVAGHRRRRSGNRSKRLPGCAAQEE